MSLVTKRISSEWRVREPVLLPLNPFKSDSNLISHRMDLPTGLLQLLPLNSFKSDSNTFPQIELVSSNHYLQINLNLI